MKETVIYLDKNPFEEILGDMSTQGGRIKNNAVLSITNTDSNGNKVTRVWDPNRNVKVKGEEMSKTQKSGRTTPKRDPASDKEEMKAVNPEFADIRHHAHLAHLTAMNPQDPNFVYQKVIATLLDQPIHRPTASLGKDRAKLKRDTGASQAAGIKKTRRGFRGGKKRKAKRGKRTGTGLSNINNHSTNLDLQAQMNTPQPETCSAGVVASFLNGSTFDFPSNSFLVPGHNSNRQSMQSIAKYATSLPPYMPQPASQLKTTVKSMLDEEAQLTNIRHEHPNRMEIASIKAKEEGEKFSTAQPRFFKNEQSLEMPKRVASGEEFVPLSQKSQNSPVEKPTYSIWGRRW